MIRKLLGKGSLTRKVAAAVDALDSRAVDTLTYISRLEDALEQLDGFDEQLQAKIDNGQIADRKHPASARSVPIYEHR